MTCKAKRAYSFLEVKSEIARSGCKFAPGEAADHAVTMTSFAVLDVEVGFRCLCPDDMLSYPGSYEWDQPLVFLPAVDVAGGPSSVTFHETLGARTSRPDDYLPHSEQLCLEPRRRKPPRGEVRQLPVLTIDVTIE